MSQVYLIRHPAVAVPPGICYGQSDVALAAPVEATAAHLRAQLPARFRLLSSPLTRCRLLAEALGEPVFDARLMEIDFGSWELRAWDEIERHLIDAWAADPLHFRAHGGESVMQMAERAISALQQALAEEPRPVVIVGHAGPLRALAGHLQGMPPQSWMQLGFAYGSLLPLEI
ncbi:alpha-ribazole phosphatase [Uliginosibacterium sp. 31-16]|uniref:alpha-ribazole phosphatase n=1 Tax=Uliginosibacterium sp. 31-16 TaxID=3068315 RepID=UPI00273ECEA8|nr:alpha-ribazole phosphatase [Uliginosibacterium sp. 31-16]MDP5239152.1 alpha-ribazole phosphatase [Uliginosibacterium sp. 31-16]